MSFLHPILLAGLALVAIPIIIHLLNQWRYQTIRWGAMMFLLAANRMARGFARLRQWLILLCRMAAIACLVFVISRPLASGWLGLAAAGQADATIVLVDRSPSMQAHDAGANQSKLDAARRQLADALRQLPSSRWVLIESTSAKPRELETPAALAEIPATGPTSASSDIPGMLQAAHDYIVANQLGRTEIWICSDLRTNDWNAADARWEALRGAIAAFPQGVRIHLLAFPQVADDNLAVRVAGVRHRATDEGGELLVSLRLTRRADAAAPLSVPVQFEIEGARSVVPLELAGAEVELREHRIPLDPRLRRGWGRVSVPADANPADNEFYFAFDDADPRRSVIVADDPRAAEPLRLAAAISPDPAEPGTAEVIAVEQATSIDWGKTALVLWQAPLPARDMAGRLEALVSRGGQVVFFAPRQTTADEIFGVHWGDWSAADEPLSIDTWRRDEDLLANTQSGMALPLEHLQFRNICSVQGEVTPLAGLRNGLPLLARAPTPRGGVHFCATTPAPGDSNLALDGVVLYVMVQRALATGAASLGNVRQVTAGPGAAETAADWRKLAGGESTLSTEYAFHAGAYAAGDALLAVNRSEDEDLAGVLADDRVAALFRGLDFTRLDEHSASGRSLIQEIWRLFLAAMMAALVAEAWLSLPRTARAAAVTRGTP